MSQPDRVLSLKEYVDLLSDLPVPTTEQIKDFADYVSGAHSWYKHLPAVPPGAPFFFYLDPNAGLSQIVLNNGQIEMRERAERGFHYADLPTQVYRDRFGGLAYICQRGIAVSLGSVNGEFTLQPDKNFGIRTHTGQLAQLPDEILKAGLSLNTAVIHDSARPNGILIFRMQSGRENAIRNETWPETDPGSIAVNKILNRVIEISKASTSEDQTVKPGIRSDKELSELLTEERHRQLGLMTKAMQNVIDFVKNTRA